MTKRNSHLVNLKVTSWTHFSILWFTLTCLIRQFITKIEYISKCLHRNRIGRVFDLVWRFYALVVQWDNVWLKTRWLWVWSPLRTLIVFVFSRLQNKVPTAFSAIQCPKSGWKQGKEYFFSQRIRNLREKINGNL